MSTTTKTSTTEKVEGQDDIHEVTLIGDDLSMLTPVNLEEEEPSTEGLESRFKFSVEGLSSPVKADNCCCQGNGGCAPRPAVSRVIDADGHAVITIILGPHERTTHLGIITAFIDSASENDIVDITIVANVSGEAGTMSQRSLLSAIDRCKGHVITHAGSLTTVGDVAIWLAADEPRMSKIGSIFMRQPISGYCGDIADYEQQLKDYKESYQEFSDFIVERNLFTKEEMTDMYDHRALLALYGDELKKRVTNLKSVARSVT